MGMPRTWPIRHYCCTGASDLGKPIVDDAQVTEECGYTPQEVGQRRVGELVMAVGCVACTTFMAEAKPCVLVRDMR